MMHRRGKLQIGTQFSPRSHFHLPTMNPRAMEKKKKIDLAQR